MQRIDRTRLACLFSDSVSDIYRRIVTTVEKYGMRDYLNQGVLVGLSGGADSVMLLSFLLEFQRREKVSFPIVAVHINHGIRGDEAERDMLFCRELCESLNVEYICRTFSIPRIANECHAGIEETARNVRYSTFRDIIRGRDDLSTIAIAHNMSDNAETVLLNILRGSGARGGAGIRPVRDNIIRPLIEVSKSEIISLLEHNDFPFVTDSTNLSSDYSRNYLRNEIIPALSRISDNPEQMLSRFAANLRIDDDYILSNATDFLRRNDIITNKDLLSLDYSVFCRVFTLMSGYTGGNLSLSVTKDVHDLLYKDNFSYSIYENVRIVCERGVCRILRGDNSFDDYLIHVYEGKNSISNLNADFYISEAPVDKSYLNVYKKSIQADLSSAIIDGSLYLRPKKDGDTVYYGGMTHKLKKLFNDRKIPLSLRKRLPILCDDRGVVWVPGFGVRDDRVPKEKRSGLYAVLCMFDDL